MRDYLAVDLAPSYEDLNADMLKTLDEHTKVVVGSILRVLQKMPPKERDFSKVMECLLQNRFKPSFKVYLNGCKLHACLAGQAQMVEA